MNLARHDGIRISYGAQNDEHTTYVVFVPLDPDLDFPVALNQAIAHAGAYLRRVIAEDIYSTKDAA